MLFVRASAENGASSKRKVADALRDLGFVLDKHQRTVKGRKQPRLGGRKQPRMTSDQRNHPRLAKPQQRQIVPAINLGPLLPNKFDIRAGEWRDRAPAVMAAVYDRGPNTPKPLVGSGFDVTSDDSRSERGIPPLNLDCPF